MRARSARSSLSWARYSASPASSPPAVSGLRQKGLVGVPDEQRVALGLRVQGDHPHGVRSTLAQLSGGVDHAHRGLTTVDDREP